MALGPGKYNDELTEILAKVKGTAGILIVLDGKQGHGFAVQAPLIETLSIPRMLRYIADNIENDLLSMVKEKEESV